MNTRKVIKDAMSMIPSSMQVTHGSEFEVLTTAIIVAIDKQMQVDNAKVLKVMRSDRAKEFPLIAAKKDGDVGFDLPAIFPPFGYKTVLPGNRVVIPTGISLEIPHGYWASIEARSSTSKKMLICPKGVIDEGYRGELFAVLLNVGTEPVSIYHGDRYVQLILHKRENVDLDIIEVDELSPSERGDSGFGSTGQNTSITAPYDTCADPNHADID